MRPARNVQVILKLVVVLVVAVDAHVAAAAGEGALHGEGGRDGLRGLVVAVADVLETGFVEQLGAVGLGVAELQHLLGVGTREALRRQRELAHAGVGRVGSLQLVAEAQGLDFAPLQIEARRKLERARQCSKSPA